jgi:hypothetical protein
MPTEQGTERLPELFLTVRHRLSDTKYARHTLRSLVLFAEQKPPLPLCQIQISALPAELLTLGS